MCQPALKGYIRAETYKHALYWCIHPEAMHCQQKCIIYYVHYIQHTIYVDVHASYIIHTTANWIINIHFSVDVWRNVCILIMIKLQVSNPCTCAAVSTHKYLQMFSGEDIEDMEGCGPDHPKEVLLYISRQAPYWPYQWVCCVYCSSSSSQITLHCS